MEPDEQPDERIEHPIAQERNGQAAPGEEVAIRQRVVEVARDEDAVQRLTVFGLFARDGHHLGSRKAVLGELPQEPAILAKRRSSGSSFTT